MPNDEFGVRLLNIMSGNPIVEKSFDLAKMIIRLHAEVVEKKHFQMASQVIRSGTSIGANIREAERAHSKRDFHHKMKIALKEAEETQYWLELINSEISPISEELMGITDEVIRLLVSITKSTSER